MHHVFLVETGAESFRLAENNRSKRVNTSDLHDADQYVANLPDDRREMVSSIRKTILENLADGFEEVIDYGMITYVIPLERFPDTYNDKPLMYAALASQKRYVSLYLMGVYADPETEQWFEEAYRQTGKRLDMGKSCVRFRNLENVPLDVVGAAIARHSTETFIEVYQRQRGKSRKR
jgi:hypothetical protein